MKKRLGFVSNSSSSSFLILGADFDVYDGLSDEDKVKIVKEYSNVDNVSFDIDDFYDFIYETTKNWEITITDDSKIGVQLVEEWEYEYEIPNKTIDSTLLAESRIKLEKFFREVLNREPPEELNIMIGSRSC